jgi:hypothetical protein
LIIVEEAQWNKTKQDTNLLSKKRKILD